MIMVQVIERVIETNKVSEMEAQVLEVINTFICRSGLLDHQLSIAE